MNILIIVGVAIITILILFAWAGRQASATHSTFEKKDVISALTNLVSDNATNHDEFDMFLAHPIDDIYLESIRQKTINICRKFLGTRTQDISPEGLKEIESLIYELQQHT